MGAEQQVPVAFRCAQVHELQHDTIITVRGGQEISWWGGDEG